MTITSTNPQKSPRRSAGGLALAAVTHTLELALPGLSGWALAQKMTRPKRGKITAQEKDWLAHAMARPLRLRSGIEIPLYEWRLNALTGRPGAEPRQPVVLLVHGMSGRGAQLGSFVAPLLAAGFRVIAFDAPGHGAAPGRRSSLPDMVAVTHEVGTHLGPLSAVIAHSNGAAATVAALGRGMQVDRVALLAPPSDLGKNIDRLSRGLGFGSATAKATQRHLERWYKIPFADLNGPEIAKGLRQPVLILHDGQDRIVPVAQSRELAAAWPGARLHITSGLGHGRILRDPQVIDRVLHHLRQGQAEGLQNSRSALDL